MTGPDLSLALNRKTHMDSSRPPHTYLPLMAIIVLALIIRGGFLYKNWNNLDFLGSFLPHAEIARNILHGHWFQIDQQYLQQYADDCHRRGELIDPQDYPPPTEEHLVPLYNDEGGYGLLLAALWKITGVHRWWIIRVLQILLDVVMCWLLYRIGKDVFSERVGLLAALLYACFIPGIELAVRPHRDIWVTYLFIFSVYQLTCLTTGRRLLWRMLAIGIATGVVAWMRSTVLLFVILLVPLLLVTRPRKEALRFSVLLLTGFVLTISPLVVRNYVVFNKFMPSRGIFWHSFWTGVGQIPNPINLLDDDESVIRFARSLDSTAQFQTDSYERALKKEVVPFIEKYPAWYAASIFKRIAVLISPKIGRELFFQKQLPKHVAGTLNLSFGKITLMVVDGLFTGCFLAGIWLARKRWRDLVVVFYPYLYTLATLAPFYLVGRNIMNVYFVVILLASLTLSSLWDRFKPATSGIS